MISAWLSLRALFGSFAFVIVARSVTGVLPETVTIVADVTVSTWPVRTATRMPGPIGLASRSRPGTGLGDSLVTR